VNFPRRLRGYAYQTFYRLPAPTRRRLARLVAPKFLVGAVAVIRDSEAKGTGGPDRLLLLRQPSHRGWGLPAGLLKKREHPAMGAARELFEETGVRIDAADLTAGVPNAIVHPVGVVDTIFFGWVPASTTTLRVDGGEVLEAAWFPVDDLPRLTVNSAMLLGRYGVVPQPTQQPQ
jgi:8-oxo-dGTP pyrophosphatase MutT (NUDIX family)